MQLLTLWVPAARRPSQTHPRGRSAARARRIWPGSWPLGRCRPSGSGGPAGLPRGWSRSEPQTRAGQSLSCRRAWGIRLACSLWPASAGVHQGLGGRIAHGWLRNVHFLWVEIRRPLAAPKERPLEKEHWSLVYCAAARKIIFNSLRTQYKESLLYCMCTSSFNPVNLLLLPPIN